MTEWLNNNLELFWYCIYQYLVIHLVKASYISKSNYKEWENRLHLLMGGAGR